MKYGEDIGRLHQIFPIENGVSNFGLPTTQGW